MDVDTPQSQTQHQLARICAELEALCARNIILVEDTPAHALLIERSLRAEGWNVTHVDNETDAIRHYERIPGSFLIVDRGLPSGDGRHLIQRVQTFDPSALAILITATDLRFSENDSFAPDSTRLVSKGEPKQLISELSLVLGDLTTSRLDRLERECANLSPSSAAEQRVLAELIPRVTAVLSNGKATVKRALEEIVSRLEDLQKVLSKFAD